MSQNTGSEATGTARVKRGMAEMLKGGVIMDVVNVEQAKIAEDAGACAVMALERVPADIRAQGGVARMSDPDMIQKIQAAHRRVRSLNSCRLHQSHRQMEFQDPIRMWSYKSWRSAASHQRRCGNDSL
jgi:pyridoxal biosynthesis lyase PdxS